VILLAAEPAGLRAETPRGPDELEWPGPRIAFGTNEVVHAGYEAPQTPSSSKPAEAPDARPASPRSDEGSSAKGASGTARPGTTPLLPPRPEKARDAPRGAPWGGPSSWLNVAGSLAAVLGLFFILAWALRKTTPAACPVLPPEVLEVLGRAPLAGRQQVHLIRLGRKLVLVSVTPAGVEALCEVTEAEEVDRLAGLCRQGRPDSATATFRQVFHQLAGTSAGRVR
jgi:flagellar biogenesis protein FliO